jgi:hypothetical protein
LERSFGAENINYIISDSKLFPIDDVLMLMWLCVDVIVLRVSAQRIIYFFLQRFETQLSDSDNSAGNKFDKSSPHEEKRA